jgi:hypothetical protein
LSLLLLLLLLLLALQLLAGAPLSAAPSALPAAAEVLLLPSPLLLTAVATEEICWPDDAASAVSVSAVLLSWCRRMIIFWRSPAGGSG